MKALFSKQSIVIASAAILLAIITIVSINVFNNPGPVTGLANAVSRPVRAVASTVTGVFERIYASIYRYDLLMADYERVVREFNEFRRDYYQAIDLAEENALLRAQLGFRERNPEYDSELAMFQNWSGSNWSHSFTIDIGYANSNISPGNAVTTEYGVLIGQVTDVGARTSTVVTVLDTTFAAGVTIGGGDGHATVRGDFNLMRMGLIMLDNLDDDQIVRPGDSIVTSGRVGVFPPGLVVGEVIEVHVHETGIGRFATVRPTRMLDAIFEVFVITGLEAPE